MYNKNIIYIFIIILVIIFLCNIPEDIEYNTEHLTYPIINEVYDDTFINPAYRYFQPWWNSTRYTRNMSYDIRGGIQNPIDYTGLWNVSPLL